MNGKNQARITITVLIIILIICCFCIMNLVFNAYIVKTTVDTSYGETKLVPTFIDDRQIQVSYDTQSTEKINTTDWMTTWITTVTSWFGWSYNNTPNKSSQTMTDSGYIPDNFQQEPVSALGIMCSPTKTIITYGTEKYLYVRDTRLLYVVILTPDYKLVTYKGFNICDKSCGINDYVSDIDQNNIIIVASNGNLFNLFSFENRDQLIKIGMLNKVFRNADNYLLITSKNKSIYYEKISRDPIYFPEFTVKTNECKTNPGNIYYPTDYLVFSEKSYDIDKINKCAFESHVKGYRRFAITKDVCIPLSEENYKGVESMPDSSACYDGEGNFMTLNVYSVDKTYALNKTNGVTFEYNARGDDYKLFILKPGYYESLDFNRQPFNYIYIPEGYYVFILTDNIINAYYGPTHLNYDKKDINNIKSIIIQQHLDGNAIICGNVGTKQICLSYDRGTHILFDKLFMTVTSVNVGKFNRVNLYSSIAQTDLIDSAIISKTIQFPRVTRSIVIE